MFFQRGYANGSKHMIISSISLAMRELQLKTTNEIPLYTNQDDYKKKNVYIYNNILAKMWRNWKSHTLLVAMSNGAATLKSSLAVNQK